MTLNTQSFSVVDNVRLINVLTVKFNCKCTIHMQRGLLPLAGPGGPAVKYISAKSMRQVLPLVQPHMVL